MISRKGLHDAARAEAELALARAKRMTPHIFEVPGQMPVHIMRQGPESRAYLVVYGKQVTQGMPYEKACMELGVCLMHALGCNGFHDGNPDYDISEEDHTRER